VVKLSNNNSTPQMGPSDADRARRARLEELITQYKAGDIDDKQLHGELQKLSQKAKVSGSQTGQMPNITDPVEQSSTAVRAIV
jgi:hypothetical protein